MTSNRKDKIARMEAEKKEKAEKAAAERKARKDKTDAEKRAKKDKADEARREKKERLEAEKQAKKVAKAAEKAAKEVEKAAAKAAKAALKTGTSAGRAGKRKGDLVDTDMTDMLPVAKRTQTERSPSTEPTAATPADHPSAGLTTMVSGDPVPGVATPSRPSSLLAMLDEQVPPSAIPRDVDEAENDTAKADQPFSLHPDDPKNFLKLSTAISLLTKHTLLEHQIVEAEVLIREYCTELISVSLFRYVARCTIKLSKSRASYTVPRSSNQTTTTQLTYPTALGILALSMGFGPFSSSA